MRKSLPFMGKAFNVVLPFGSFYLTHQPVAVIINNKR